MTIPRNHINTPKNNMTIPRGFSVNSGRKFTSRTIDADAKLIKSYLDAS